MAESAILGNFAGHQPGLTSPAGHGFAVTPHDSNLFTVTPRALWVGTGGTVVITGMDGVDFTLTNVANGTLLPIMCLRVKSTSTTASGIVGIH